MNTLHSWYRIFEIVNNAPVLVDTSLSNWHDTQGDAESFIPNYIQINKPTNLLAIIQIIDPKDTINES